MTHILTTGLGLSTLKEQREHYKTYVLKEEPTISPELQRRFDHGHECEVISYYISLSAIAF